VIIFRLPDLGEGLSEAEIVRWHVKVGDLVAADQPMVSVETAKAVVEVPSPVSGVIRALHGAAGDRVETGAPLIEFAGGEEASDGTDNADHGSVVGVMPSGSEEFVSTTDARAAAPANAQRIQAVPAARALARSLGVDLALLSGSGRSGLITLEDVIAAGLPAGDAQPEHGSTLRPALPPTDNGAVQPLRSLRRAMSQSMAMARDSVMECTVFDDADLHRWQSGDDYTVRVLRAIAKAQLIEPGLNAWYDASSHSRRVFDNVDVGLAVDTPDGLLVPVIRDVGKHSSGELRAELDRLRAAAVNRTVRSDELRGFTFMLSNFGMMAGRYATPVVVPPAVAILGTGRARADVVAVSGNVEIHQRMPLSLTFDHRVVTGGEAVRFLGAIIRDLELSQ
jgi:pyruvate dehydrogenase E2 component (dihydrolipoamide acetyltransferase)